MKKDFKVYHKISEMVGEYYYFTFELDNGHDRKIPVGGFGVTKTNGVFGGVDEYFTIYHKNQVESAKKIMYCYGLSQVFGNEKRIDEVFDNSANISYDVDMFNIGYKEHWTNAENYIKSNNMCVIEEEQKKKKSNFIRRRKRK